MKGLCVTRPADWWETDSDGARLALALCSVCPELKRCGSGRQFGVIRAGVAWNEVGNPAGLCGCGYPLPCDEEGRERSQCLRCEPEQNIEVPRRLSCPAAAHDTRWAYIRHGCRCPAAVEDNAARNRRSRERRRYVAGTHLRGRLASGTQVDMSRVHEALAGHRVPLNTLELAAALDLYDNGTRTTMEIAEHLGCTTRTVTRRRAARREAGSQAVSTVVDGGTA